MSRLKWDEETKRLYETGVSNLALYVWDSEQGKYGSGVAWNGVSSVNEAPSGADSNPIYADNIKYLDLRSAETLDATLEAYMYPDEFMACDGTDTLVNGLYFGQQNRKKFCLAYKTILGNDTDNNAYGYKLHVLYGCTAAPSQKQYASVNESPEAIAFSWEISTAPIKFTYNGKDYATSVATLDSTKFTDEAGKAKLQAVEDALFGSESEAAHVLMPNELAELLTA